MISDPARETRDIKIVAFTAYAMKGGRVRILAAGCDGCLPKPVEYKTLLETVRAALSGVPP